MKKSDNGSDVSNELNVEYVVLQMTNKTSMNKSDNLDILLQESDSVTYFRNYLDSMNSGHYLDFWFACEGFKNFDKSDSHKLSQLMKVIYRAYVRSESPFSVPLKSSTKKLIIDNMGDKKSFNSTIFDTAQLEIRDILADDFLTKFYKSEFFTDTNMFDRGSLLSTTNSQPTSEVPASSSSSTGCIRRRFTGLRHLATSCSSETVSEANAARSHVDSSAVLAYTTQNTGTITSTFSNTFTGLNTNSKDRRNLSEIDPLAFANVLSKKLEDTFIEKTKFDRILRLVKSVPNESDTDDSNSSAVNYLMGCQMYSGGQGGNCCSVNGDMVTDYGAQVPSVNLKLKSTYYPTEVLHTEVKDEYAQDILESHCSRIGEDQGGHRHGRRECSEDRRKWRKEIDLGSTTSYDSGVATSLEQYSNLGIPPHLLDTMTAQWHNDTSKNASSIDLETESHRYHHHHHRHHHKNHTDYKDFLTVNNLSDVSSNFDSGISSTYEHLGRGIHVKDDKVTSWMSKNPKITSKTCYNFNDSFLPSITSGIPSNTPRLSTRSIAPLSPSDTYIHQSCALPRCYPNKMFSPLPDSGILPCQSIKNWLDQQDASKEAVTSSESCCRHNYCSSTIGVAGSELLLREEACFKNHKPGQPLIQYVTTKEQQRSHQSQKSRSSGPLVVGYYIGNDPVPYRTQVPDAQYITLGEFKSLIAKKGPFRYFFKRYCDEFESGVVHEEITRDDAVLPLWEGKVVAKIEKSD